MTIKKKLKNAMKYKRKENKKKTIQSYIIKVCVSVKYKMCVVLHKQKLRGKLYSKI